MLRAVLTNSTLVELKAASATLSCPGKYAQGAKTRLAEIAALFEKELGRRVDLVIFDESQPQTMPGTPGPRPASAESPAPQPGPEAPPAPIQPATANPVDDPLVKTALELFSAKIVSVQPRRRPE